MLQKTAACITTYNPNISRLKENVLAIAPQVKKIFLIDNASSNRSEIKDFLNTLDVAVEVIWNDKNYGLSKALNIMLHKVLEQHFSYAFLLDQDSIASKDMVSMLLKNVADNVGLVSPVIIDRNTTDSEDEFTSNTVTEIPHAITSGTLLNLEAWKQAGGYDENLFLDFVDIELCFRLRSLGYKLLRNNNVVLLHELGHFSFVFIVPRFINGKFMFVKAYASNHSLKRKYDMAYGLGYCYEKYSQFPELKDNLKKMYSQQFRHNLSCEKPRLKSAFLTYSGWAKGREDYRELVKESQ